MLQIVPAPVRVTQANGTCDVRRLALPEACPFGRDVMIELWTECGDHPDGRDGLLEFRQAAELAEEGYTLAIGPGKVRIGHATAPGAYYGLVTLCELMRIHGPRVPCVRIEDRPHMAVRGATDDISRGQISTLEHFKSIVRRLSFFKMNTYMPYLEDVFRFHSEPDIGKYSDPVPADQWRQLSEYARRYFVNVRPIFNTLGHWDRIGPLEKYRPLMIAPDGVHSPRVLDPEHPQVRPLLARLLGELVDAFGPGLIHVGGDEPGHLTQVHGPAKAGKLFTEHYRWMHGELKNLGCQMMLYADVFVVPWGNYRVGIEAAKDLPRDIKLVYWNYNPYEDYSGIAALMDLGFETYLSPGTMTCRRFTPETFITYLNAANLRKAALGRAAGILASSWGNGTDCPRELAWPGFAAAAEVGWAAQPSSYESFINSFHRQFFGFDEDFRFDRIEPVYRTDGYFGVTDYNQVRQRLWRAFWADARRPPDEPLKERAADGLAALEAARRHLERLTPRFNGECWACIAFGVRRLEFVARKLLALETGPCRSREQAKAMVPPIRALAEECRSLMDEGRTRWFASNRQSQWKFVESMYLDLIESFESLARCLDHRPDCPSAEKFLLG